MTSTSDEFKQCWCPEAVELIRLGLFLCNHLCSLYLTDIFVQAFFMHVISMVNPDSVDSCVILTMPPPVFLQILIVH